MTLSKLLITQKNFEEFFFHNLKKNIYIYIQIMSILSILKKDSLKIFFGS